MTQRVTAKSQLPLRRRSRSTAAIGSAMTEADHLLRAPRAAAIRAERSRADAAERRAHRRTAGLAVVWAIVLANAGVIVWLWAHADNLSVHSTGEAFTSVARITGLLGAYLALIQVLLLARLPWLERLVGFDRLTVWHRWNGFAVRLADRSLHVVFSVWGYALDGPPRRSATRSRR